MAAIVVLTLVVVMVAVLVVVLELTMAVIVAPIAGLIAVMAAVVVVEKKVFFYSTMGGVILRLGTLPGPWESENTSEDLRRS